MKKSDWILLLLILSTFITGIVFYSHMPNQVPIHWNIKGEVDGYAGRFQGTFMMPFLGLGMFLLFLFLPKLDPRNANYKDFRKTYRIILWAIQIFFIVIYYLTLYHSLVPAKNIPKYLQIQFAIPFLISILFIILGNYMGKVKDNFFVGFRNPWTLSSKEVWYKTHRLGGKLFVISGILGIIGVFIGGTTSFVLLLVPILLTTVVTMVYSYLIYKNIHKNE